MARVLLRDGHKVGAEVSPEGLEVFTYEDQKGQLIHALATVEAASLGCPHGAGPSQGRGTELRRAAVLPRRNHRSGDRSKLVPPPLSGSGRPGVLQS